MVRALLILGALWAAAPAAAAQWTEGVHYERIASPQPPPDDARIEVFEAFWYRCPTCYNLEPYLQRWLEQKPADVEFVRAHASLAPHWRRESRVYFAAEALGVVDEVHQPLFDAIHVERKSLSDIAVVAELFERHAGIDRKTFRESYSSFGVDRRMREADRRMRDWRIGGVPTIVVNGKYWTTPGRAEGYARTIELIKYLIELEREP